MIDLMRCPFCNSSEVCFGGVWRWRWVKCEICGALGANGNTPEEAAEAWNKRGNLLTHVNTFYSAELGAEVTYIVHTQAVEDGVNLNSLMEENARLRAVNWRMERALKDASRTLQFTLKEVTK